jgi:hypothetical protein
MPRCALRGRHDVGNVSSCAGVSVIPLHGRKMWLRESLEKKFFWIIFLGLSLLADAFLPLLWGMLATLPICVFSWWVAYRSGWLT